MFGLIKKAFIELLSLSGSLASIVNASDHAKCLYLNNQQHITQPTLIKLHHNKYIQGLDSYPFAVNLDRRNESCNTLNDTSSRICVINKIKVVNLRIFKMITGINESKTLTKHISYKCICKFDTRKCSSNQKWNNDKCQCEYKNLAEHHVCVKKVTFWNPVTCTSETGKCLTVL